MPGFIGLPEIVLFLVVALLVFGPKKLPEMGKSLGKGLREFKDSVSGDEQPTAASVTALGVTEEPVDHFAHLRETPAAAPVATPVPTNETRTQA